VLPNSLAIAGSDESFPTPKAMCGTEKKLKEGDI